MVLPAVQTPSGLTYEGIKDLRTNIGQMLTPRAVLPDDQLMAVHLKQIYGAHVRSISMHQSVRQGRRLRPCLIAPINITD